MVDGSLEQLPGGRFTLQGVLDVTIARASGLDDDRHSGTHPGSQPRGAWGSAGGATPTILRSGGGGSSVGPSGRSPGLVPAAGAQGQSPPLPAMSLGASAVAVPGLSLLERDATVKAPGAPGSAARGAGGGSAGSALLWSSDLEDPGRHLLRACRGAAPMAPARLVTPPALAAVVPQAPRREDGLAHAPPVRPGSMRSLCDPHCDPVRLSGPGACWMEAAVEAREMRVAAVEARLQEAARLGGVAAVSGSGSGSGDSSEGANGSSGAGVGGNSNSNGAAGGRTLALDGVPTTAHATWPGAHHGPGSSSASSSAGGRGRGGVEHSSQGSSRSAFDALSSLLDPQASARRRSPDMDGFGGAGAGGAGGAGGLLQRAVSGHPQGNGEQRGLDEAGSGAAGGAGSSAVSPGLGASLASGLHLLPSTPQTAVRAGVLRAVAAWGPAADLDTVQAVAGASGLGGVRLAAASLLGSRSGPGEDPARRLLAELPPQAVQGLLETDLGADALGLPIVEEGDGASAGSGGAGGKSSGKSGGSSSSSASNSKSKQRGGVGLGVELAGGGAAGVAHAGRGKGGGKSGAYGGESSASAALIGGGIGAVDEEAGRRKVRRRGRGSGRRKQRV